MEKLQSSCSCHTCNNHDKDRTSGKVGEVDLDDTKFLPYQTGLKLVNTSSGSFHIRDEDNDSRKERYRRGNMISLERLCDKCTSNSSDERKMIIYETVAMTTVQTPKIYHIFSIWGAYDIVLSALHFFQLMMWETCQVGVHSGNF